MNVREALKRTKHWVDTEASRTPGFQGVYVAGSVARMPLDAALEPWRDVDLVLVTSDASALRAGHQEVVHEGVIIECALHDASLFQSPEGVLSTPDQADNVTAGVILADPTGTLRPLHERVAAEYGRRKWVRARCEARKQALVEHLRHASQACEERIYPRMLIHYHGAMTYLAGLTALANLCPTTVRRCFAQSGELLERQGRADLHEASLELLGCSSLSPLEVEQFLADFIQAFDRALEVKRGEVTYDFKFRAHLRPSYLDGTRELIREGRHREATFWILGFYFLTLIILQHDAPEQERPAFQARFDTFFGRLGFGPRGPWPERLRRAKEVCEQFSLAADEAIARNPSLTD